MYTKHYFTEQKLHKCY